MLWVVKEAIAKQSGAGLLRSRSAHSIPYFDDELFIDGLWLKRLRIGEFETALCADTKQEIRIKRIDQAS